MEEVDSCRHGLCPVGLALAGLSGRRQGDRDLQQRRLPDLDGFSAVGVHGAKLQIAHGASISRGR